MSCWTASEIADLLHYDPKTVRSWIARHHSEGLAGLKNLAIVALPLVAMSDTRDIGGVIDSFLRARSGDESSSATSWLLMPLSLNPKTLCVK